VFDFRAFDESLCGLQFLDVRTVLGKNPKGQKVLAEYDQHKTLSSEARQTLVKVVVAQLVHDCGPLVILTIIDQLSLLLFAVF
jgi:hypothetical protein